MRSGRNERERSFYDKFFSFYIRLKRFIFDKQTLKNQRSKFSSFYPVSNPLISVYTPTFNRSKILKDRAIKSVLKQSYKKFEYIIVGDGCTDDTKKIVKNIKDKRIKFINIKRKKRYPDKGKYFMNHWYVGAAIPSNTALKLVKGDWVARLDDWAIWPKNHLRDLLTFAQKNDYEFVTGASKLNGKKHRGLNLKYLGIKSQSKVRLGSHQSFFYRKYLTCFKYCINSWRRKTNKVLDVDLIHRMIVAGVKIGYLDKVVAIIKPRPGNKYINSKAYIEHFKKKGNFYKFHEK
jgi:glycosyltransferase involved in cell wall biosynthesis